MVITAPAISVSADVRRAKRALARLGHSFPDGSFAQAVGLQQERAIDTNFRREGNEDGPWPRLKAATLKARVGGGINGKILQDKRHLARSFESARVTNTEVRIGPGSNVVYAATHEYGDPSRNIPERRVIPKRATVEADVRRLLDALINKKTRAAGF